MSPDSHRISASPDNNHLIPAPSPIMTPVTLLPISDPSHGISYRAILGDKQSIGKTAGQALDALLSQLNTPNFSALLLIQNFEPDPYFTAAQQTRLTQLMEQWRTAQNQGQTLPPELQTELNELVDAELNATRDRAAALLQQPHP
jgi:hypothetical protein